MKKYRYESVKTEVTQECPFCPEFMEFTGVGYTTYGMVDVWTCQEHGDTWVGTGCPLINMDLVLA